MPTWFQRPENALKRANELLEVGKKLDALTALHDIIKSRRHRTWTKVHEQIMTKHLELCVELRKPHIAKDGLFQYRNMCQQVNVKSLETVICSFLANAEKRAAEAKAESKDLVEDVAEDLDQAESPETMLLKAVSGEDAQDRADRTVLSPWLKFLWESYRQCLELLRNNIQVEQLYHKIAKQAFQFCLNYQRRAEFKKLCDNLRTHLNQLQKMQNQSYAAKLSNVETIALHQETRLTQLEVAIKMELWQEAFKSIEDLHNLQPAKYKPKPQVMSNYYEKLALVFWKAGNTLFHAAALYKLYLLHREMKKSFNQEEATLLATRVVLSVLSITTVGSGTPSDMSRHLDMEEQHLEHSRRLSGLLSMPAPPTRNSLIKEIIRFNVIATAVEPAQKLYQWLETDFHPLSLAKNVQEQLVAVETTENPDFTQYIDTMKVVASVKLLKQVSQVYQTISIKRLGEIIPFMDAFSLERMMVTMTKKSQLKVRVDHRRDCFVLGAIDMTVGDQEDSYANDSSIQMGSGADDETVNGIPSSDVRHHLQQVYTALSESVVVVDSSIVDKIKDNMTHQIGIHNYHSADRLDHVKERKKRIEHYLKDAEERKRQQEKIQQDEERLMLQKRQAEEEKRMDLERQENEVKNKQQEKDRVMKQIMTDRLKRLQSSESGRKVINEIGKDELENLDTETLLQKQVSQMERERRDLQSKLKQQERKWDHFIRACHMETIQLWEDQYENTKEKDREQWEEYEQERCIRAEKDQQMKIETSKRLERVAGPAQKFLERVREAHQDKLKERIIEFEQTLIEKRAERLKERKEKRKQQRKSDFLKKQEEEKLRRDQLDEQRRKAEEDRANNLYVPPTRLGEEPPRPGGRDDRSGRRDLSPDESRSEGNWRRSAPVQPQAPVRDHRAEQAATREPMRAEPAPTPADSETSWRRPAVRAVLPEPPVRDAGPPPRDVAPPPSESASSWRRVAPVEPPPAAPVTPVAAPAAETAAPAKNVWVRGGARAPTGDRPAYRGNDDPIAPSTGTQVSDRSDSGATRHGESASFRDGNSGPPPRAAGPGGPPAFSSAVRGGAVESKTGMEGYPEQNGNAAESDYTWDNYYHYCMNEYNRAPTWTDYETWYMKTYNRKPIPPPPDAHGPPGGMDGGGYSNYSADRDQPNAYGGGGRSYGDRDGGGEFGRGDRYGGGGGSDRFSASRRGGYAGGGVGGERGGGGPQDRGGERVGWRDREPAERDSDEGAGPWRRGENLSDDRGRGGGGFGGRDTRGDRGPPSEVERDDWRGGGGQSRPPPRGDGGGGGFDSGPDNRYGGSRDGGPRGGAYRPPAARGGGADRVAWREEPPSAPRGGGGSGGYSGGRRPEGRDSADEGEWRDKGRPAAQDGGGRRPQQPPPEGEDGDWQQVNRRR